MLKSIALGAAIVVAMAAPAFACDQIASKQVKISACVDDTWQAQTAGGDQEYFYLSDDGNIGFTLIGEQGTGSASSFRSAILTNASTDNADVKVLGERIENVAGKPWNVIEFQRNDGTNTFIYDDFYYLAPGFGAVQFIYWTIPDNVSSASFRAGQMMATIEFGG